MRPYRMDFPSAMDGRLRRRIDLDQIQAIDEPWLHCGPPFAEAGKWKWVFYIWLVGCRQPMHIPVPVEPNKGDVALLQDEWVRLYEAWRGVTSRQEMGVPVVNPSVMDRVNEDVRV